MQGTGRVEQKEMVHGEWKAGREWEEGKGRTGRNKKLEQKVRV